MRTPAAIRSLEGEPRRALNIAVVAEGIETEAQAEFLLACGCHVLQGYLLGSPMPPEQLASHVRGNRPLTA